MNNYELYIKSHCEAPDYEDQCEANTLNEAAEKLYQQLPWEGKEEWSPKALLRHIEKDEPDYDPVLELEKKLPVNI